MNYRNYNGQIVSKHNVQLVGWPLEDFANPSTIKTNGNAWLLLNRLKTDTGHWVRLSHAQGLAYDAAIRTRRVAGKTVGVQCTSVRSDKNGTHKRRDTAAEDDNSESKSSGSGSATSLGGSPPPKKKQHRASGKQDGGKKGRGKAKKAKSAPTTPYLYTRVYCTYLK